MSLNSILRKLAGIKEKVQKGSNYDKINLADDVRERSPLVVSVVKRTARILHGQIIGSDITALPEDFDTNSKWSARSGDLVLTSVEENPLAGLITYEIVDTGTDGISIEDNHISITYDDGVTTNDEVIALVEGDDNVSALITIAVDAGQGAVAAVAQETRSLSNGLY